MSDQALQTGSELADLKDNFITQLIEQDLARGVDQGRVHTRFPPEPNGFLHIGHAKSICLNFGLARKFPGGKCNLRFDDTNPEKESQTFIDAIEDDVRWLAGEWDGPVRFASEYFDELYACAVSLIEKGLAYVCELSAEEVAATRGTLTRPGQNSPFRDRPIAESLDLFQRMREGEFADGGPALRARIDMASANLNLRDPVLYRIRHQAHHQTGDRWCIYPMYDFTHPISDALEGITHSLCTLEFEDHRPLYDWVLDHLDLAARPRQTEFARLNVNYTVTSKRKLKTLVDSGLVSGWDDPRLPTLAGMRRRGVTAAAVRSFCNAIGVTRSDSVVDVAMLEFAIREDLNRRAPRAMCVLRPLKVTLTNCAADHHEFVNAPVHPQDPDRGFRRLPFGREILIDREDFRESANKHFKRLVMGGEVRLRNAYVIRCDEIIRDAAGEIIELRCTYDPETLGRNPEGRKVRGVIHWVEASASQEVELRLYDRLFMTENPESGEEINGQPAFMAALNPQSMLRVEGARVEAGLLEADADLPFQFEREGYFFRDPEKGKQGQVVFNRTITLRDTWAKMEQASA